MCIFSSGFLFHYFFKAFNFWGGFVGFLGFHTLQESAAYTDAKNNCGQTVKAVSFMNQGK